MVLLLLILNVGISRQINRINKEVHLNRLNSVTFLYQMIDSYVLFRCDK